MTTMPHRSLDQRQRALAHANEIRFERSHFKRGLRDAVDDEARWIAASLVISPPAWAENWPVWSLLLSIPKFGKVKVSKLLLRTRIAQGKRIGGLSQRQRDELVEALTGPRKENTAA